ncbi:fumarylacetoacetate hydrolase family protein [Pseudoalteromonas mariniglutinosa]|uniref:fumarylacetoacetate hydrolase family protein n=1 Tax=Pseudoalteromonas mariniglutinosa TaxID=206042 RepID=UPI00385138BF
MHTVNYAGHSIKPTKIICVGRNYAAHIAELNNETPTAMVLFFKPNSAITETLCAEHHGETLHYETELCFLVKNNRLAAVGLGLDLTKRTLQTQLKTHGLPWERAKAFDGSALFTEFVDLDERQRYQFTLHIDDQLAQHGECNLMLYKPETILAEISQFMTLEDGDIIMTGTPAGVGEIKHGQFFTATLIGAEDVLLTHHWQVS